MVTHCASGPKIIITHRNFGCFWNLQTTKQDNEIFITIQFKSAWTEAKKKEKQKHRRKAGRGGRQKR